MSGFESVIGFLFSFVVLMLVFVGLFSVLQSQITEQSLVLEQAEKDSYLSKINENFEINSGTISSGRTQFLIQNTGSDKFFFKDKNSYCLSVYLGDTFIDQEKLAFNPERKLSANYEFVEQDGIGILTLLQEVSSSENITLKVISCGDQNEEFNFLSTKQDWWDSSWLERNEFAISNPSSQALAEYQIKFPINATFFNFSSGTQSDIRFLLPLKENVILDLPLDEESASFTDYSEYDVTGFLGNRSTTDTAEPSFVEAALFKGLRFDGIDDVLTVNSSTAELDLETTLSFWLKWNESGLSDQVLFIDNSSGTSLTLLNESTNENGKVQLNFVTNDRTKTLTTSSTFDTSWHLLTVTYNSRDLKLYVDATLENSTQSLGNVSLFEGQAFFGSNNGTDVLNGTLDEIRFFNLELTSDEVEDLYHNMLRFRELDFYITSWDEEDEEALAFVKIPYLGTQGSVELQLYYNNINASSHSDIESTFSYTIPRTVGYVLSDRLDSSFLGIMALYNDTNITVGDQSIELDALRETTFSASDIATSDEVKMDKLSQVEGLGSFSEVLVPISWAGTEFHYSGFGDDQEEICILSPFGLASVDIRRDSQIYDSFVVGPSGTCYSATNNTLLTETLSVESDLPILVSSYGSDTGSESLNFYPASTELYGVASSEMRIGTGSSGAEVIERDSTGDLDVYDLTSYEAGVESSRGSNGNAPAAKIESDTAIGVSQRNDGDGQEMTTFVPRIEMGTRFGSSLEAQYVAAVSPYADAACTISTEDSTLATVSTGTGSKGVYVYYFDLS